MEEWSLTTVGRVEDCFGKGRYYSPVFLGKGAYGTVSLYAAMGADEDLAYKSFFPAVRRRGLEYTTLRELAFYGYLASQGGHPTFPVVSQVVWRDGEIGLVMEASGQGMSTLGLKELRPRDQENLARQLVEAVCFLTVSLGIVQRDIKSANLLWDHGASRLSIIDWGISRCLPPPKSLRENVLTPVVQTLPYRAPELLLGESRYSPKIEVWSLGIVLLEMWSGTLPVSTNGEIEQLFHYFRLFGTPNERTWPGVSSYPYYSPSFPKWTPVERWPMLGEDQEAFLRQVLIMDPNQRPSIEKVQGLFFETFGCGPLPPPYETKTQRDHRMAVKTTEAFNTQWRTSKDRSYQSCRSALWSSFSEMESRMGDLEGTMGYAFCLLDRFFAMNDPKHVKRSWHLLALAAVWVVAKLGHAAVSEDLDHCLERAEMLEASYPIGKWTQRAIVTAERQLLTGLSFCLVNLSPHAFWEIHLDSLPPELPVSPKVFYEAGIYLLDLWETSPDYPLVLPQDASQAVYRILMNHLKLPQPKPPDECPTEEDPCPVTSFLTYALENPLGFKDISVRLRHNLTETPLKDLITLKSK
jgi:serine/threonine protein kinase